MICKIVIMYILVSEVYLLHYFYLENYFIHEEFREFFSRQSLQFFFFFFFFLPNYTMDLYLFTQRCIYDLDVSSWPKNVKLIDNVDFIFIFYLDALLWLDYLTRIEIHQS